LLTSMFALNLSFITRFRLGIGIRKIGFGGMASIPYYMSSLPTRDTCSTLR
jgi:hypothetical protein